MVIDYLSLILQAGFKLPDEKTEYDEQLMVETGDHRAKELRAIIRLALHDMSLMRIQGNHLFFKDKDGNGYEVIVTRDTVSCNATSEEMTVAKQREFYIIKDRENYFFERMLVSEEGILEVCYYLLRDGYNYEKTYATVQGYDKTVLDMFAQESIKDQNFIGTFRTFLGKSKILPDIAREIKINNRQGTTTIKETDTTGKEPIDTYEDVSLSISAKAPMVVALESYIRARNYLDEINKLKGLPVNFEEEIKDKLRIRRLQTKKEY